MTLFPQLLNILSNCFRSYFVSYWVINNSLYRQSQPPSMCQFPNQKIGENPFSQSYGVIFPSSFDMVLSSALRVRFWCITESDKQLLSKWWSQLVHKSVGVISRFMDKPRSSYLEAAYQILRYIKTSLGRAPLLSSPQDIGPAMRLLGLLLFLFFFSIFILLGNGSIWIKTKMIQYGKTRKIGRS